MVKEFPWKDAGLECYRCGVVTDPVMVIVKGYGVRGWRCPKCGEEMLHPQDAQLALRLAKEEKIEARVSQLGRQTIIRVPALIRDYYGLDKLEKVTLRPRSSKELVLEVR